MQLFLAISLCIGIVTCHANSESIPANVQTNLNRPDNVETNSENESILRAVEDCNQKIDVVIEIIANFLNNGEDGETPLDYAVLKNNHKLVEQLIEHGAYVDGRSTPRFISGRTPLQTAVSSGSRKVLDVFIKHGVDISVNRGYKEPLLHLAASNGNAVTTEKLIELGVNVNATSKNYKDCGTALHAAAMGGFEEVVQVLLKNGIDVHKTDDSGKTALHSAADRGHSGVVDLLIRNGADFNQRTTTNDSALTLAAMGDCRYTMYSSCYKDTMEYEDTIKLLIRNGADINCTNRDGQTALHVAASRGYDKIVEILLQNNADRTIRDKKSMTPLDLANEKGEARVINLLKA